QDGVDQRAETRAAHRSLAVAYRNQLDRHVDVRRRIGRFARREDVELLSGATENRLLPALAPSLVPLRALIRSRVGQKLLLLESDIHLDREAQRRRVPPDHLVIPGLRGMQ